MESTETARTAGSLVNGLVAALAFAALVVLGAFVVMPDAEDGAWVAAGSSLTAIGAALGLAFYSPDHRRTYLGFVAGLTGFWAVMVSWLVLSVSGS